MDALVQSVLEFVAAHSGWAVVAMFIAAFGESFVFVSLLFPGTTLLIAAGTLVSKGTLPYWPVLIGSVVGATLGDWVSYWLGRRFGGSIARLWPFSRNPDMLGRGIRFFQRNGGKSVFIGRFFGPLRAVIPLAAGIMQMPGGWFGVANVGSALVWAPMLLFAGDVVGKAGERIIGSANTLAVLFGGITVIGIGGLAWAALRARRPKL
ncbi:MAG TPA: DedA family protein [Stellaceae bacterium]|nr:DedA family protein [Stellaceae bacterium]